MSIIVTANIPIRKLFKNFISIHYGLEVDPLEVNHSNNLGRYIRQLLSKPSVEMLNNPRTSKRYNDNIEIVVPGDMLDRGRFVISTKHIYSLDLFIKEEYYNEIKRRIVFGERMKLDQKDIIDDFIVEYNLHDLTSYDTINTYFRRNYGTKKERNALKRTIKT